jgi:hypothetical protein
VKALKRTDQERNPIASEMVITKKQLATIPEEDQNRDGRYQQQLSNLFG